MVDVRMPDGTIIQNVPDGMTRSQLQARLDKVAPASGYNETATSQGLSGVNEGIAGTLGFPVDVVNSGLKAVGLPMSDKPILGSDWIKGKLSGVGAIGPESRQIGNQFVRRVGQSVGAAAVPIAGTAGPTAAGAKAFIPAVAGGGAAAASRQIAPDNPWAEMGSELVGSLVGGGINYSGARRAAKAKVAASVPTIPDLKKQASDMYDLAERNGVKASQQQTTDLADTIARISRDEGLISPTGRVSEAYPKAKEALQLTADYAKGEMAPKQMQTVRKVLSEAAGGPDDSERRIAKKMLEEFDNWTAPMSPELAKARAIARRYINAGKLETARELAGSRAGQFSGSGFENALRTEYRNLDRQVIKGQDRGFTPDTVDAIKKVSRGTPVSNAARYVGKLAPTGAVSSGFGIGVPFAIGNSLGGPAAGTALAVTTPTVGLAARGVATRMGINNARMAELIARNGGNLPDALVFSPEVRRLIAAQLAGQSTQYLGKNKIQNNRKK